MNKNYFCHKKMKIITALLLGASLALLQSASGEAAAKYVFLFIGDGMGFAQRNVTERYLAGQRAATGDTTLREAQLRLNALPVSGSIRTASLSGVTDSAAAGTALATGKKTKNGALALNPDTKARFRSIAYLAKDRGMKVGIVSSAFIQDATPAAFYAQAEARGMHYAIGQQLAESGFDYFAGGGFRSPTGKNKDRRHLIDVAKSKGYRVTQTLADFRNLAPGGKTFAIHPNLLAAGYMPWAIDGSKSGLRLVDFVRKGIELLDGNRGFFMMVEGAKVDVACHANDAAATIQEVMALDEALAAALEFRNAHLDDTLIVVAADHETGGMTLSPNAPAPEAFYLRLAAQKGSYAAFERTISPTAGASFESYMTRARGFFGAELQPTEAIRDAFRMSMTAKNKRPTKDAQYKKRYGPYDPLTMACIRELDTAVGIAWTTFYHTGKNVPVTAIGQGAEAFAGEYENTEIFEKIERIMR